MTTERESECGRAAAGRGLTVLLEFSTEYCEQYSDR